MRAEKLTELRQSGVAGRVIPAAPHVKGRRLMKIVVWKSPKALRGILRALFRVKTPKEGAK